MRHYTIPIFIPELACPNRCLFCNQRNISGSSSQPSAEEVVAEIEKRLSTISPGNEVEIGFFGGNFTGIELVLQEYYLSIASPYVNQGKVSGIRVSTRPDYINHDSIKLLKKYAVSTVELGAQSLDEEVLAKTGRGHSVQHVIDASGMIRDAGLNLGLQMMIGLPGDSFEKSIHTAKEIVRLGASSTRIYPTLVIRETELETLFKLGKYAALSLEQAIDWTKEIVKIFETNHVRILRIGLHPSEGLLTGENLVAGPFHVAFGEMVRSALWKDAFIRFLGLGGEGQGTGDEGLMTSVLGLGIREGGREIGNFGFRISDIRESNRDFGIRPSTDGSDFGKTIQPAQEVLLVEVPVGQLNAAVGHKAENKIMLMKYFRKVIFRENPILNGRNFIFKPL